MESGIAPVELEDGPLRLRPPRREEVELYARWWADEEVAFGFCCEPRPAEELAAAFPEMAAEARDTGHWLDYVMEVDGRPVGLIWLSRWDLDAGACELNILIGEPESRLQGVGRRAVRLLCAWAFPTMGLRQIRLCPREDHVPAIRSYRAAGARLGEVLPEVMSWRGETVCFRELYFLREDFP
jgi:RimJ/RimL family protein N-acetyltransferase